MWGVVIAVLRLRVQGPRRRTPQTARARTGLTSRGPGGGRTAAYLGGDVCSGPRGGEIKLCPVSGQGR